MPYRRVLPPVDCPSRVLRGIIRAEQKEQHPVLYSGLLLSGKLYPHLLIDEACEERMAKREGVTEALKASDQMGWVARMNNIRNRAEEIVLHELVSC